MSSWSSCHERGMSETGVEVDLWPWGALIIAVGVYAVVVAAFLAAGRREDARAIAGFIPDCIVLVGRLARDSRVSRPRRALLLVLLAYLALPIDLIPDFLPGAGQLDDAVLLVLALRLLLGGASAAMLRQAWPGPEASLRVILRASGHEKNGSGAPERPSTL
jgi:uncharacterized membrane protein YkvA (DUF1232 family)